MKKALLVLMSAALLQACSNNGGESGVVNDGMKTFDNNGALQDTAPIRPNPSIDSTIGEDRVDTERRGKKY